MIITVEKLPATAQLGVRVVATSDQNHREWDPWDYNAPDETNYLRAARAIASDAELIGIGVNCNVRWYRSHT